MNMNRLFCVAVVVLTTLSEPALADFSFLPAGAQREVGLVQHLFAETNQTFDAAVCKSLPLSSQHPSVISFRLVSFVFYYPTTNDWMVSYTELEKPDGLVYGAGGICRTNLGMSGIPVNYVRLLDSSKRHVTADVDVLLGVSPVGDSADMRYFRRSFHFAYQAGWKEIR